MKKHKDWLRGQTVKETVTNQNHTDYRTKTFIWNWAVHWPTVYLLFWHVWIHVCLYCDVWTLNPQFWKLHMNWTFCFLNPHLQITKGDYHTLADFPCRLKTKKKCKKVTQIIASSWSTKSTFWCLYGLETYCVNGKMIKLWFKHFWQNFKFWPRCFPEDWLFWGSIMFMTSWPHTLDVCTYFGIHEKRGPKAIQY